MKKKLRKILKIRRTWVVNPKTRIKKSLKKHNRAKIKKELREITKRADDEKSA